MKTELDPRSKLVIVFSLSTMAVFIQDVIFLGILLIISFFLSIKFSADSGILKKIKKFIYLFIVIAILQSVFSPGGSTLIEFRNIKLLTAGGMIKGLRVILRMLIIILSATIMTGTSSREIVQGMVEWKIPYEIAFMVSLAIRFLPLLTEEARDVFTAIQLRGIDPDRLPFKKKFQLYSSLLLPILTGVIYKAREISTSLETRGFRAYPYRTSYLELKLKQKDYTVIVCSLVFTLLYIGAYVFFNYNY